MSRKSARSRLAAATLAVLLAGFSLLFTSVAPARVDDRDEIKISECRGASYHDASKHDLCDREAIPLEPYRIETIEGGRGELQFPNQTRVTVFGKSSFKINHYDRERGLSARLESGRIRYASGGAAGMAETLTGKALELTHLGTTLLFTVGPEPSEKRRGEGKKKLRNDRDGDQVADDADSCPKQNGIEHSNPSLNGCPVLVERVVLLPDDDGHVGTVAVQRLSGGELARLDRPFSSVGITITGEWVQPIVAESSVAAGAAPALQPNPASGPAGPEAWCREKKHRHCCTTPNCGVRDCCWVKVDGDFCRTDPSWTLARCFEMDALERGGGGEGHGAHFQWTDTADSSAPSWPDLGCRKDGKGRLLCTGRPARNTP